MRISQSCLNNAVAAKKQYPDKIVLLLCNPNMSHLDFSALHNICMSKYDQSEFDEMNDQLKEFVK